MPAERSHPAPVVQVNGADPNMEVEEPFTGLQRFERHLALREVSYYLTGDLREAHHYAEMFNTLRTSSESDLVLIHLNSPGGDFDTGLQIINNMRASPAHVVTVLEARAFSMAALIFLAGDEWVVHDNSQLMFHIYSGILSGRGTEQQAEMHAISHWFDSVMRKICPPFLTDAEITRILQGSDLWMDSDEVRKRMARIHRKQAQRAAAKTAK